MKKKSNPTHNITALKQEIVSLREGLQKTAGKLAECMVELEDVHKKWRRDREEADRLDAELFKQKQYQTRAHETIELLVKKMPYGQEPPTQYVVTSQFADAPLRAIREGLRQRAVKEGR